MKNEHKAKSCCSKQTRALLFATTFFICCVTSSSHKVKIVKHRLKTCNETMLRDKLRVFVCRISPPLRMQDLKDKSFILTREITPQTKRSIGLGWVLTSTDFLTFQSLGLNNSTLSQTWTSWIATPEVLYVQVDRWTPRYDHPNSLRVEFLDVVNSIQGPLYAHPALMLKKHK